MRSILCLALLVVGACDGPKRPPAPNADAPAVRLPAAFNGAPFPQKGEYLVTRTAIDGKVEESSIWVNADNRVDFEQYFLKQGGSNCRDRKVDIGGGQFSASETCDAPDGDIHNIGGSAHGSYTADSVDMSSEIVLWGSPMRETVSYRLIRKD